MATEHATGLWIGLFASGNGFFAPGVTPVILDAVLALIAFFRDDGRLGLEVVFRLWHVSLSW